MCALCGDSSIQGLLEATGSPATSRLARCASSVPCKSDRARAGRERGPGLRGRQELSGHAFCYIGAPAFGPTHFLLKPSMDAPSISLVSPASVNPVAAPDASSGASPAALRGADFANMLGHLMAPGGRQDLAGLQALPIGPQMEVITVAEPLPDAASLSAFARGQGLDESMVRALFGATDSAIGGYLRPAQPCCRPPCRPPVRRCPPMRRQAKGCRVNWPGAQRARRARALPPRWPPSCLPRWLCRPVCWALDLMRPKSRRRPMPASWPGSRRPVRCFRPCSGAGLQGAMPTCLAAPAARPRWPAPWALPRCSPMPLPRLWRGWSSIASAT
jgi:hypothetical protein